jgi:hypothetical protein
MSHDSIMVLLGVCTLLLAILGWAYMLGFSNARIVRNERDIETINIKLECAQKVTQKREDEFRKEIRESFEKTFKKIDDLPCHNPGWSKGDCE